MSTTSTRDESTLCDELPAICNLEGITLIWYDENIDVHAQEQLKITEEDLRSINNYVIFVREEQSCINIIKSIKDEKILLVISGSAADHILSLDNKSIHKLVHTVFIFCYEKDKYQSLLRRHSKINGIYTDAEELKLAIKNETNLIQRHFEIFTIYEKNEQKSICDLSQERTPFIWLFQLKLTLTRLPKDKNAKSQMIDTCRKYYHGNKSILKSIEEFDHKYKPEHAIRWYTESSFVYKIVNKALRVNDLEQLYVFRFYISDLCQEIDKRHKQITDQCSWLFYRGARLPLEDIERLQQSENELILTNGFLSTSILKTVAMRFAFIRTAKNTEESVLFEIECDNQSATFAFIEKDSAHPEEKEVLFDLATTFKVLSVTKTEDQETQSSVWVVRLRSTQEGRKEHELFGNIFTRFLDGLANKHVEVAWGLVLEKMGQPDKAVKYFQKLLNVGPTNTTVEVIHWAIISPLIELGRLDEALQHHKLSALKQANGFPPPPFYCTLSDIYRKKGQFNRAIDECKKALMISIVMSGEYTISTIKIYNQLGQTYFDGGQYELATDNFIKAKIICQKYYSDSYNFLGEILSYLAEVYRRKKENVRALAYYEEEVQVFKKLSSKTLEFCGNYEIFYKIGLINGDRTQIDYSLEHLYDGMKRQEKSWNGITPTFRNRKLYYIGLIHLMKGEFETSLQFFETVLSLSLRWHGPKHSDVAQMYYCIGLVLELLGRNDEALIAFTTALDIQKNVFFDGHRELALTMSHIGNQYRIKKEFSLANSHCDEAIDMQNRILPPDDADAFLPLYHKGLILYDQEDYKQSLQKLWKALKIRDGYIDHMTYIYRGLVFSIIGDINIRINNICLALRCFKDALSSYEIFFSYEHPILVELRDKIMTLGENSKVS